MLVFALAGALAAPVAKADTPKTRDHRGAAPMAPPEVRDLVSSQRGGDVYRAIVADTRRGEALTVEILDTDRRRVAVRHQEEVTSFWLGRDRHRFSADEIGLRSFRGQRLLFEATLRRGTELQCIYRLGQSRRGPRCRVVGGPRPSPPRSGPPGRSRPPRGDRNRDRAVRAACEQAVTGRRNRSFCVEVAADARFDPSDVIRACGDAVTGSSSAIECVEVAAGARREISDEISACGDAISGSGRTLECVRDAAGARFGMARAIRACESAMTGSGRTAECVGRAAEARRDPADVIRRCERDERSSRRRLRCVEDALSRGRY